MTLAADERAAICAAFLAVGPDRPTLCEGWTTRDLLAHLLVREREPWASPGILVPLLAPLTERAMAAWAGTPWPEMVEKLRAGAPPWSPYALRTVDGFANGAEFFVHHEDVRRGEPGWEPRPADPTRDAQLWSLLGRMGRWLYRRSPVGVVLRRPAPPDAGPAQIVARTGDGVVTVVGEPGEIVLHAFGRDAVLVRLEGAEVDVEAFRRRSRGL